MDLAAILTALGLIVTIWLAYWTFKRTEVLRIKDTLIGKVEDLPIWLLNQVGASDLIQIDELYSGKISHLEMRLKQLNQYAKHVFAGDEFLSALRNVNIEKIKKEDVYAVHNLVFDLIEKIEIEYFNFYYSKYAFYHRFIKPHAAIGVLLLAYSPLYFVIYFVFIK